MRPAFIAVLCVVLSPTFLHANSLEPCTSNMSLSGLVQSGGCFLGSEQFTNFQLFQTEGNFGGPPDLLVTPTKDSVTFTSSWDPTGQWTKVAEADKIIEMGMAFEVAFLNSGQRFGGLSLDTGYGGRNWGGEMLACLGASNQMTPYGTGQSGYSPEDVSFVCSDPSRFAYIGNGSGSMPHFDPTSSVKVAISLNFCCVDGAPSGTVIYPYVAAGLDVVHGVPEPTSSALLLIPLLAAGWLNRRKRIFVGP